MKKKIKVVVLMGGKSPEHEVSVIGGSEVVKNLDAKRYLVSPVVISKTGSRWTLTDKKSLLALRDTLSLRGTGKEIVLAKSRALKGVSGVSSKGVDVVFVAMHGPFGEDGTVQGMLELSGIPYTGSGVLASAVGMDKIMFRKVMVSENISVPKFVTVKHGENFKHVHKVLKHPPYFVKPSDQGSSVGASIVKKEKDLGRALKLAHKYSGTALVDEYVKGIEVTCAVIGNERPIALPVIEIKPLKGEFFDYESKYTESGAEEIIPARIAKSLTKKIQDMAVKVYKAIGCRGFARIDFILKNKKDPVVLEINTIPGLTPMSLLPKAAKAAGISYPKLLDRIINHALSK
ncbi:MAG: D-alanine-D-alanine ligase [Candidatus Woesebacteria bacterium GW2011_GWB1_45_5]|uniref:D-alanine--D-alanine ligase n=1 Tax=Candidatus Woesebacteria bacterium GW2011_GWB1_45_5 TaxID=1618581 RepID=A0A0G1MNJ9_9BACT|nr:MAG: D-alanine-D-alanine ligase [Candidatus Woesebacteria bacterium GW2011_GWB1_45_5]